MSLALPRQNLSPSSLIALFPVALSPLCFSLLHLSLQTHSPSVGFLQLVHISNPHFMHTPPSRHPVSPSFPLSSTSCRPLPLMAGCGGSGEQRGVCWFSLIHIMPPTSLLLCPSSPSLSLCPPSLSPNSPCLLCQFSPPTFPASFPKPTPTSSSNLYSSLSLITSSCPPCGWRTKSWSINLARKPWSILQSSMLQKKKHISEAKVKSKYLLSILYYCHYCLPNKWLISVKHHGTSSVMAFPRLS